MDTPSIKPIEIDLGVPEKAVELAGFYPTRYWNRSGETMKANLLLVKTDTDETLVFGSLDTLFLDKEFHDDLQARLGGNYHLYLVASHTHNAPSLARSLPLLGNVDDGWYQNALDRIVAGIKACPTIKLTQISQNSTDTDLLINRRLTAYQLDYELLKKGRICISEQVVMAPNIQGEADKKIKAVFFRCSKGRIRAVIWSLAAHPAFSSSFWSMSADFPGRIRLLLKQNYGGDVVSIFLPGLAGSAIPKCRHKPPYKQNLSELAISMMPFHKSIPPFDEAAYELWSKRIFEALTGLCDKVEWEQINSSSLSYTSSKSVSVFKDKNLGEISIIFRALAVGREVNFILMNGEPLGEWAALLAPYAPADQLTIVSGYSTGNCLYIPPEAEIKRGGYEVKRFQSFFGLDGMFVENIDDIITTAMKTVIAQLKK